MLRICVVGMPVLLRSRFEASANRRQVEVTSVIVAVGKEGRLEFRPDKDQAVGGLLGYYDALAPGEQGKVIVLPYTTVHPAMRQEIEVLEQIGTEIVWIKAGSGEWPDFPALGALRQQFLDQIFAGLSTFLPAETQVELGPAEYFRAVAEANARLLITDGALDICDEVAKHRYKFMRTSADALAAFLKEGVEGRIDAHFSKFGLVHAQSGGVSASFILFDTSGEVLHSATSNVHLKQGDKTTKIAAARVYYQALETQGVQYVAVLYAGPHPDADIFRTYRKLPVLQS